MSDDRYTAVSNASSEDPHMMFSPEVFAMIGVDLVQKNSAPSHFAASAGMSSAGGPSTGGPSIGATEGANSIVESGVSGGSAGAPPSESAPPTASAANNNATDVPRSEQRAAVRAAVAADPELIAAAKLLFAASPAGAFPDPNTPTAATVAASGTRGGGPHPTSSEAESQIAGVVDTLSQQQRMIAHDQREIDLLTLIGRELKDMAENAVDYELDDFGLRALVLTAKASADRIAASSGNSSSSALLAPGSLVSPSRKRHAAARDFATSAYSSQQSMQQSSLAHGLLSGDVASDPAAMAAAAAAIDTTIHRYFSADGVLVSSADTARRHDEIISDARGLYQQQLTVQRRQRRELFKQLTDARGRGEATTSAAVGGPDVSAISVPSMPAASGSAVSTSRGGSAGKPVSRAQTPATGSSGSSLLPASASLGGGIVSAVPASAYPLSRRPLVDLAGLARGSTEGGMVAPASGAPHTGAAAGTQSQLDAAKAQSEAELAAVEARTTSTLDLAAPSDALAAPSATSTAHGTPVAAPSSKTLKQLLQEQRDLVATAQRKDAGEYQPVLQRLWAYNAAVQDRMDQLLALPLTQHAQRSA